MFAAAVTLPSQEFIVLVHLQQAVLCSSGSIVECSICASRPLLLVMNMFAALNSFVMGFIFACAKAWWHHS
jgi:hypothetical protein